MEEERPIIFTVTPLDNGHYKIYTEDSRADLQANCGRDLYTMIASISEELNNKGYAVLFEVD